MVDINFKELRAAIINLNQSGLVKKKLSLVGVAKEKIYEDFMVIMDKMENDPETNEFPEGADEALAYFNKMVDLEKKEEERKAEKDVNSVEPNKKTEKTVPVKLKKKAEDKKLDKKTSVKPEETQTKKDVNSVKLGNKGNKKTEKKESGRYDQYGLAKESYGSKFMQEVAKKAGTMTEICLRPFNVSGSTYYSLSKRMIEMGFLIKKDGIFSIVKKGNKRG